ncbi:hypothetical protein H312_02195 [Anncaliia algerae PRA339]|uniref:Uncharacterized protein n=1 Tax=Anncaliia algerae PRA339 TaxID=1288291 RepID=A0A059F084_9MICR|nr:hypothetical protein H312_02195 [Anncaliia algerae PRA339]
MIYAETILNKSKDIIIPIICKGGILDSSIHTDGYKSFDFPAVF